MNTEFSFGWMRLLVLYRNHRACWNSIITDYLCSPTGRSGTKTAWETPRRTTIPTNSTTSTPRGWVSRQVKYPTAELKVLIVDDYEIGARALQEYFCLEEIDCHAVFRGLDAIAEGIAWQPDVILMDISMPELTGYDTARALRQEPQTSNLLIIAFTALDEQEVRQNISINEFDGYCQKGTLPGHLLSFIESFFH